MNIGRVHTPPIFIARGVDPLTGGIGAHDEYLKDVHPSHIYRAGYRPLNTG